MDEFRLRELKDLRDKIIKRHFTEKENLLQNKIN